MGEGRVYHVSYAAQSRIIKRTASTIEHHFYQQIVPRWPAWQRHTPTLHWAIQDAADWWLALEAIPHPLPQHRRLADPEFLAILWQLHHLEIGKAFASEQRYQPAWPASLMQQALDNLDHPAHAAFTTVLERYREEAQNLFVPTHPISGDPNPANWGLRDDDNLVLFDWERFTLGNLALDLAITVPGLGQWNDCRQVAATYLSSGITVIPGAIAKLTRAIALAKLWTVLALLTHNTLADARRATTVRWLRHEFPGWLRLLRRELG